MTLLQLIALLTVQETGSIRAAARSLFQTQAAVTKTIKNLENDIGATLIIREARGVHLTEDGETLALHARHALRELELARDQIRMRQGDQQSAISLAVTPAVMYTVLPECIEWFRTRFPFVKLTIEDGILTHALPLLRGGLTDFALVVGMPTTRAIEKELYIETLGEIEMCFAVRDRHPLLNEPQKASDPSIMREYEWIITADKIKRANERFEKLMHITPPERVLLCTPQVAMSLVENSDAITVMPKALVQTPNSKLKPLPSEIPIRNQTLQLIMPHDRPITPAMEYLIHILKQQCQSLCITDGAMPIQPTK